MCLMYVWCFYHFKLRKKNAVYVLLFVFYFSLSVQLLIVVKNIGHILEY